MTDLLSSSGAMSSISSMIGISFDLAAASNAPLTGAATLITTRRLVPDCRRRGSRTIPADQTAPVRPSWLGSPRIGEGAQGVRRLG